MRYVRSVFLVIAATLMSMPSYAADFRTPERAIQSLEAAYVRKDLEAAVQAKDFNAEAKLMLQNINPDFARDSEILKKTAEALELSFRKEIKDKGFPNFSGVKCSLSKAEAVTPTLVRIAETCVYLDGGKSVQDLNVIKGANGWRVVNLPPKR